MKKYNVVLFMIILLIFLILILISYGIFRNNMSTNTRIPLLKVVVKTPDTWIYPGKKMFYNVYENGFSEEVHEFSISTVETYYINKIENINEYVMDSKSNDISIYTDNILKYARNIIEFTKEKGKDFSSNKLYVISDRYFFDIFDEKKEEDIIFEYLPDEGQIRELIGFKSKVIEHVELYKP